MKEKTTDIDILEEKEKKEINILKILKLSFKDSERYKVTYTLANGNEYTATEIVNAFEATLNLIKTLIAENKELKEKDDANLAYYDQIYQNGIYTGQKAVEYKIKAKIEELNKEMLNEENSLELFYRKKYCKEVLQSLLEKE